MRRVVFTIGSLLCLMSFTPRAISSSLKTPEDKAPLFLFVLNAAKGSTHALSEVANQLRLQIPREEINFVQMYSRRSGAVFTEFRQPGVRDLWKSVNVDFKNPAKATLAAGQSPTQIVEILGLEVTPSSVHYRINSVGSASIAPQILKDVTLTMDAAATWKACSEGLPCLGYGSPLLNTSVCYGDHVIRDQCPDCECCVSIGESGMPLAE